MKKLIFILTVGVASLALSCKSGSQEKDIVNTKATLPVSLGVEKTGLKLITSSIHKKAGTMSVLYGTKSALSASLDGVKLQSAGQKWTLITWKQQDDPTWFGAQIPGNLVSVEEVDVIPSKTGTGTAIQYTRYEGPKMTLIAQYADAAQRIKYIFGQKPSVMP